MLALQIPSVGQLELVKLPKPVIAPKTVLMRVAACGICGTDPHILHGMYPATLPLIPGHEYAGTIEAVGDGVSDLSQEIGSLSTRIFFAGRALFAGAVKFICVRISLH